MGTPNNFVPLTKRQGDELCQIAGVALEKRDRFIRGVENSVASYMRSKRQKSAAAVEEELLSSHQGRIAVH
jgi:hypothetical protein